MNTPRDDEDREDLRYAEYVLGVLDADTCAEVEHEIARDPRAASEVARWQEHLLPLAEDVAPVAPPARAWSHLSAALSFDARDSADAPSRTGWESLALWRWFALGASAVAAACIVLLLVTPRAPVAPPTNVVAYYTSRIQQDNGLPGWTATVDAAHAHVVLVPAAPNAVPAGRVPELWLIPAAGKPVAIGVFAPDKATTLDVPRSLLTNINAQALLAVSLEPPGGSPTGQPTGPVVAKGALSGG